MTRSAFDHTFAAISQLIEADPDLARFAPFDPAPRAVDRPPNPVPAVALVQALAAGSGPEYAALLAAIAAVAPLAHWRQTYTEDEVGRDFLNRYGYFELIGPAGHFHSDRTRAYIAYWGAGLHYPWHLHEAEELYLILAGRALFEADGQPRALLGPGDMSYHASNQPHAMTTGGDPLLALILWRGAGFDGQPRMGRE